MTTSDFKKAFKQLKAKPVKLKKYIKHNAPKQRSVGRANRHCKRCNRVGAHIRKYKLGLCRHCFRDIATKIGWKQYS